MDWSIDYSLIVVVLGLSPLIFSLIRFNWTINTGSPLYSVLYLLKSSVLVESNAIRPRLRWIRRKIIPVNGKDEVDPLNIFS
ncbi:hypothetical protein [Risungbinella massiliensis]|uniref:hypothetical protein n=1 Tax=Risungbinella massiliensis TaxID=1329796 RepID=UPI0005CC7C3A|nr:hypothetical protein [Risungbinella massiliensis]